MSKWEIFKIGDVCDVIAGQSPKGEFYNSEGLGLPFYQGKKEFGKKFISSPQTWTTSVTKVAIAGDILMSIRAPVGPVNFATQKICIGRGLAAIRARESIDKNFLFYYLFYNQDNIKGNEGAVFASINKSQIQNISLPVPPIEEQKRIVEILDKAFEGIAQAEANTRRNLINARELFDSYLNNIFRERGDEWIDEKLGDISENLDSERIPVTKSKRTSGKVPYYGASGVVDYVDDFIFDEELLLVSEDGANLLARTYPIAFSISGKAWVNNHAHVLKFNDISLQRFIEYFLNSISLERYVSGMAQPKLNQKALNSILIPIAPKEIREKVVNNLDSLKGNVNSLETIYQRKLEAIAELKQSILEKAFTGQLSQ
ncbi:MAG: restriction endonuclease subunit S [Microcystis wesenbergii Mw_MB_S_20031200_S109]|uniref:Restriction endonuclease subunit S n=1 Tax=Microcystis wesenbergii Mw_MB_S_20031200_S109D TaxID=2486241 RepID=A0A552M1A3_9CHRO|nr:MAG: restriction endonuclease subunit S [Microcystis wesenbergii Mw_MB_S_20031200_S109]TRV26249.1 MAG: restriction endonuclease subunit S [Microcystis wesenbergii Mw_MB_S_20031200_S109D]